VRSSVNPTLRNGAKDGHPASGLATGIEGVTMGTTSGAKAPLDSSNCFQEPEGPCSLRGSAGLR
jgi:hypothetical protein